MVNDNKLTIKEFNAFKSAFDLIPKLEYEIDGCYELMYTLLANHGIGEDSIDLEEGIEKFKDAEALLIHIYKHY